ncbi:hypothetical protein EVAR_34358_1 [Eumeta japonica]|uniref:Uncharacterized protein n=1 Tax=Eumeta variegata TaxID=151549 RepID=A0A4C1ZVD3_EUMVA|nr:hypothetical protein EVAR_34358_1 [Eumeta japonica]
MSVRESKVTIFEEARNSTSNLEHIDRRVNMKKKVNEALSAVVDGKNITRQACLSIHQRYCALKLRMVEKVKYERRIMKVETRSLRSVWSVFENGNENEMLVLINRSYL